MKTFTEKLSNVWDTVKFQVPELKKPREVVERTLIGDVHCKTNTTGEVDNSVLQKIAAVSR